MSIKLTNETFIERAKSIHGDLYNYKLVDYKNSKTKIKIVCSIHGEFLQTANDHLSGSGCKSCASEVRAKSKVSIAKSEFANKANLIHNNKYSYELVDYKTNKTKVKITCKSHGVFEQQPTSHLSGKGCPLCALSEQGWTRTHFVNKCTKNNNSQGILYILGCWSEDKSEVFIKIGITSNSIKKRYGSKAKMPYNYKVLHEITGSPEYIYNLETLLHKKSKHYKYIPITPFDGSSTECFEANKDYLTNLNTYMKELVPF